MIDASSPDFRQLAHALRNHLFTISLAMKSLELTRDDPERFASLLARIRTDTFAGLEDIANTLDALATEERSPRLD